MADALKLLGGGKAFQSRIVREYAVDVLRKASDNELKMVLLQLVQALRYEPSNEIYGEQGNDESGNSEHNLVDEDLSPLGQFLVERACCSTVGIVYSITIVII